MDKVKPNHSFWEFVKEFFSFYKLSRQKRENAEKPKDLRTWLVHGLSEFFGTILLSLGLAGLSIYTRSGLVAEEYLIHPIIVGFYAGFIVVGAVLFIFLRWSCDLNPSVSLFRYLNGTNNGYYTTYKIFIQFAASIVAAGIIFGLGKASAPAGYISNAPIDAVKAVSKLFEPFQVSQQASKAALLGAGFSWVFFVEMVMTAVLLFPIFSPNINNKYRDLFIMFIISMSVWMGILGGSAAINPARGFAQQLPTLFPQGASDITAPAQGYLNILKDNPNLGFAATDASVNMSHFVRESIITATVAMILGDLIAPVFYIFVQGLTQTLINPFVVKVISYKNYKAANMEKPADKNKNNNLKL